MSVEHPLVQIDPDATLDQLQHKISELTKKLSMAHRMGNAHLANQVRMALTVYQNCYQDRMRQEQERLHKDGKDYSDRIDIS